MRRWGQTPGQGDPPCSSSAGQQLSGFRTAVGRSESAVLLFCNQACHRKSPAMPCERLPLQTRRHSHHCLHSATCCGDATPCHRTTCAGRCCSALSTSGRPRPLPNLDRVSTWMKASHRADRIVHVGHLVQVRPVQHLRHKRRLCARRSASAGVPGFIYHGKAAGSRRLNSSVPACYISTGLPCTTGGPTAMHTSVTATNWGTARGTCSSGHARGPTGGRSCAARASSAR